MYVPRPCTKCTCFQCTNEFVLPCIHQHWFFVGYALWTLYSLEYCVEYLVCNFPPCSAGLLWPQPEGASPQPCHALSGLQYREESTHPACTWWCVWWLCVMCVVCFGDVWLGVQIQLCEHLCQCIQNGDTILQVYIIIQYRTLPYSFGNCSLYMFTNVMWLCIDLKS